MERVSPAAVSDVSTPLSMGIKSGEFLFVSGQAPLDLETGAVIGETVQEQTQITLDHVGQVLEAGGLGLGDVVKVTAFITEPEYFDAFNEAYREYFDDPYPARSCVVTRLVVEGMKVEIEAIARE